eukprot:c20546_g1_i3.p2 GENE.c20546_g1_i3~~c20546_g1_i3.p2  ORF type:complete len:135 (-),score=25.37 c20546_g1_i3:101-505(-)
MFSYGSGLAASLYVIETLEISRAVHTVRSLDIDNSSKVSVAESMEISRRFAIAYEYLREQPDVAPLIERLGLKDSEVNKTANLALFEIVPWSKTAEQQENRCYYSRVYWNPICNMEIRFTPKGYRASFFEMSTR